MLQMILLAGLVLAALAAVARTIKLLPAAEFGGTVYTSMFTFTASALDLANHTAVASVDTTVSSSLIKSGDTVIAIPPAALEAGIAVVGCHTVADGSFKLRTTNASAGAIDPAAATWEFLVYRK
ncbi:MAG: hypothetical protein IT201_14590 [Thermoleophilia bacterium]|nr:hypothetical protein [Thermoleophilia bacterium]